MSQDHCTKLSKAHISQVISESTKLAVSLAHKGKKQSQEWINKKVLSITKKTYQITDPIGNKHIIKNYNKFCKENNLSAGSMSMVLRGTRDNYKGFKIEEVIT
jgi:hypothetical protein